MSNAKANANKIRNAKKTVEKTAAASAEQMGAILVTRDIRILQRTVKTMALIIAGLILIAVLEAIALMVAVNVQPDDRYFAATTDNRILELTPMDQPNVATPSLLEWASRAMTAAHTFDFTNYQSQLESATNKYFTAAGKSKYLAELQRSGTISRVTTNRYVTSLVLQGSPVVLQQGRSNGVYLWRIQAPALVTYESNKNREVVSRTITITVVRSKEHLGSGGIAISQFVVGAGRS